ncbi:DUF6153 family protein [Amnibacterium flavum]|uniref:Uncharacterized protein n=1 Tax=Amnibacterium flavum TaxID=2173173 RepID=A0A2V1HQB1_9MICO|nr:DUF6153 family protein [Amnibacterium flavum]PVZ93160.1 hypothetical protein DDQ50_16690 [Amnibacterium flavum]
MSMISTRAALRPKATAARTILLPLLAVVALLLGLLAMHSLNLDTAHAAMPAGGTAHAEAHLTMPAGSDEHVGDCGNDCAPEHSMLTMACVLALLVGSALIAGAAVRSFRNTSAPWRVAPLAGLPALAVLIPPKPPSLLVLSISRT